MTITHLMMELSPCQMMGNRMNKIIVTKDIRRRMMIKNLGPIEILQIKIRKGVRDRRKEAHARKSQSNQNHQTVLNLKNNRRPKNLKRKLI